MNLIFRFLVGWAPETLNQCCLNVDTSSETLVQHRENIGSKSRVYRISELLKMGGSVTKSVAYLFVKITDSYVTMSFSAQGPVFIHQNMTWAYVAVRF